MNTLNTQQHNPYQHSDYCPHCCMTHVTGMHPDEDEGALHYAERVNRLRIEWDKDYR